nr:hypothetical protein [uncultured Undibacterium sp.]
MRCFFATVFCLCLISACRPTSDQSGAPKDATAPISAPVSLDRLPPENQAYPILFVTQVPLSSDKNGRLSAFANHMTRPDQVPRGGDLMLFYPDGILRNLTKEANLGVEGFQGKNAIAVREPAVHWSGKKALFSMLTGAPRQGESVGNSRWQIYEVIGLEQGQKSRIQKVAGQDVRYNNLSPIYGSDDSVIFTSDRPRNGEAHLYPQLDEYEATASTTGIWKLHQGKLQLLSHTPSGAFNPLIDSFGRIIFTRWDHLQQDQLADRDRDAVRNQVALPFRSFNYADESANAKKLDSRAEFFPESRVGGHSVYGEVSAFRSNFFTIWQIHQDGSAEETLNHVGLHELSYGYLTPSFIQDANLSNKTDPNLHQNRLALRREGGLFQLREDPLQAGTFFGINARESGSFATDSIVKVQGDPRLNPEQMQVLAVTPVSKSDNLSDGRYRNPLPLANGGLIASHTSNQLPPEPETGLNNLRLRFLNLDPISNLYKPGDYLSKGIKKKVSWWDGNKVLNFEGDFWELEPVEVRPRKAPTSATPPLDAPEKAVLAEAQVEEQTLRDWLLKNELALIITRDQTSRDRADLQQPFNLEVPGGVKTLSAQNPNGKLYQISHFQIVQAEQLRAYPDRPGRRNLAQPLDELHKLNYQSDDNKIAIIGAVKIAKDGSTAVLVPSGRALSWQTTDAQGNPVVRERNWISFKAGEIRVCASCHGVNTRNQANFPAPIQKPLALKEFLNSWKNRDK